ncbi:MAG: hypothetical protein ACXVAY_09445 [Mucilaginibacter sp.]
MISLWIVKKYIQHRLKATTRHGLHSPFVYRLVDKVVYDKTRKMLYADIEKERKALSKSNDPYSNTARIDQLLYRLVADLSPANRANLSTVSIVTERYLLEAAPGSKMYGKLTDTAEQIDLVVINSEKKDEILDHFNCSILRVHPNSMIIVSRIYRNKQANEAWEIIKTHPEVSITVDLFWIGLVFFRLGKVKEDFWIRF